MSPDLSTLTHTQVTEAQSLDFARYVQCRVKGGTVENAAHLFDQYHHRSFSANLVRQTLDLERKAAVAPGDPVDATWAGALTAPKPLLDSFLNLVRPLEVLGQLVGTMTVPWLVPVPIYTPEAQPAAAWIGSNAPKPVAAFNFSSTMLPPAKVAIITTVTAELLKVGTNVERALRDILAEQIITEVNRAFLDPARAPVVGEFAGSITAAGTEITTTGTVTQDAAAVLAALVAARPHTRRPALILSPEAATQLGATSAVRLGPDGVVFGILPITPIITGAAGTTITAVDPSGILTHDDGITIDLSRQASIVMDSDPGTGADQIVTSFWMQNFVGLRAERFVAWKVTDATAVQYATVTP